MQEWREQMLYQITSALNHYRLESGILIGSHQREHLLKMDSTDDFSRDSKTNWLPNKGLHHWHLYSKIMKL